MLGIKAISDVFVEFSFLMLKLLCLEILTNLAKIVLESDIGKTVLLGDIGTSAKLSQIKLRCVLSQINLALKSRVHHESACETLKGTFPV